MIIPVNLGKDSYDIVLERGCIRRTGGLLRLGRKVLVVTDDGVPETYARTVAAQCPEARIEVLPQGEENKNFAGFERLLRAMLDFGMTRKDCVAAVGGGVIGDMAGFAAACYMRGIDFYNIPTTVLPRDSRNARTRLSTSTSSTERLPAVPTKRTSTMTSHLTGPTTR